jgi:hypothetical protein
MIDEDKNASRHSCSVGSTTPKRPSRTAWRSSDSPVTFRLVTTQLYLAGRTPVEVVCARTRPRGCALGYQIPGYHTFQPLQSKKPHHLPHNQADPKNKKALFEAHSEPAIWLLDYMLIFFIFLIVNLRNRTPGVSALSFL